MRTLNVFNSVTLDGYFTGVDGDMNWAHKNDPEWIEFTQSNAKGDSVLLFGRKTYDMMKSFWPTPAATQTMPDVAKKMNSAQKFVFSRTLKEATWENTQVINGDITKAVRKLKSEAGPDMLLMGSGEIISQLTAAGLIDGYQVVTVPVIIGAGRTMFEGVKEKVNLERTNTRSFGNGNVVNWYTLKK
ncbi:MAG: dihydrofolate reductase family protein [Gemmatimonas sp.]